MAASASSVFFFGGDFEARGAGKGGKKSIRGVDGTKRAAGSRKNEARRVEKRVWAGQMSQKNRYLPFASNPQPAIDLTQRKSSV